MTPVHHDAAERIDARRADLVARIVQRHYERVPELQQRYGAQGRARCAEDAEYHLGYLSEAIRAGSEPLFVDYVSWARELLESRSIPASDLEANLAVLEECLAETLPSGAAAIAARYVAAGRAVLTSTGQTAEPQPLNDLSRRYLDLLIGGNRAGCEQLLAGAIERGTALRDIYTQVLAPAQHEIGRLWQRNKLTVAQEHLCTAATDRIMSRLLSRMSVSEPAGMAAVVTSVASEQHSLGARMLADFLEMDGWDVHYLGANTPASSAVEVVRERHAAVLAVSATMTYHLPHVRDLIIRARARAAGVKVLVGGHPFNVDPTIWQRIGADGYAANAADAVVEARRLASREA